MHVWYACTRTCIPYMYNTVMDISRQMLRIYIMTNSETQKTKQHNTTQHPTCIYTYLPLQWAVTWTHVHVFACIHVHVHVCESVGAVIQAHGSTQSPCFWRLCYKWIAGWSVGLVVMCVYVYSQCAGTPSWVGGGSVDGADKKRRSSSSSTTPTNSRASHNQVSTAL